MPTYQPNIPTGIVNLDQDYVNIQGNFEQANVVFNVDHVPFDDVTNQKGYHTSIHFNPVSTTSATANPPDNVPISPRPAGLPGFGQLFSASLNDGYADDTALFFMSGGSNLTQFTANIQPEPLQNGYTFWPGTSRNNRKGAVVYQWGLKSGSSASTISVAFNIPFANDVFNVQIMPIRPTGSPGENFGTVVIDGSVTKTGFKIGNYGPHTVSGWYWTAIGI